MIKKVFNGFLLLTMSSASAFAGELGVTNSYGHSFRQGTGTTNIQFQTNSQLSEQSIWGSLKIEKSSFDEGSSGSNNGFGNGDQDSPGKSGKSNNAENASGIQLPSLSSSFTDKAVSGAFGLGFRNYTETGSVSGTTKEDYSFGSTNFTHSVGVFSR